MSAANSKIFIGFFMNSEYYLVDKGLLKTGERPAVDIVQNMCHWRNASEK